MDDNMLPDGMELASEAQVEVLDETERALSYTQFPVDELARKVRDGAQVLSVKGLRDSFAAAALVELQAKSGRPLVIVGPSTKALRALAEDLEFFSQPKVGELTTLLMPSMDVTPYVGLTPNRHRLTERLSAYFYLTIGELPRFLLLPIEGLMRLNPPSEVIESISDAIGVGSTVDITHLRQLLVDAGYTPVQLVEDPGTFAIRGGIIDVFSPIHDDPIRIELFDDEVETIRYFDPRSQRSQGDCPDGIYIFPVREEIFTPKTIASAREKLRVLADQHRIPSRALRKVLADLEHGMHFLGIEALLPAFYETLDSTTGLMPEDALVVVLEPDRCRDTAHRVWKTLHEQFEQRKEEERLTFPPDALFDAPEVVLEWLEARQRIELNPLEASADTAIEFRVIENRDIDRLRTERGAGEGALRVLVSRLESWREVYGEIGFVCRNSGSAERLASLLRAYGQKTELIDEEAHLIPHPPRLPPAGVLRVYQAGLSKGFRAPALGIALVTEDEIFGPRARRRSVKRETPSTFLESFRELKPGDHLVHVDHGIGRYDGLKKLDIGGRAGDFLLICYANDDKLYIPVTRLGGVQKFSGEGSRRLDKLGSTSWDRTKSQVKEGLKELAIDLLRLYAERQSRKGFSFSPPDEYFREFEAAFPFEETPDQARAIEAIISDLMGPRPMDRLLCGDVGFGKTEVSMRAAFKAVLDNKQVAVLVPTTLLAEQHHASFRMRFSGYPVEIESLSRFRSTKESKQILKKVKEGRVDILIGTHRLLSKDIEFRDLGLLVVDEEHRFGVAHKEKIKQISATVDVLVMTATPIPRTLQMSLMGMRDLSVIATPPRDRLEIKTHVARFGGGVIREAVVKELKRGGQVYFLHNRVRDISKIAAKVAELVPEARVGIAHGQMDERSLEKVMLGFIRGDSNVLVCTTIIESGIDIPNANAIIINNAHALGLAQLYQIRGRVGRSSQRAHCYLLVPEDATISVDAQQRLEAIQRFTELGSGLEIANWDLELRGAGNLLGAEQSGNIAAVGLDLFAELLEETISEIKGEEHAREIEPEINLPVEARLPEDYIPDVQLRLLFYKRLSSARNDAELFDIYGELKDRFGTPPKVVESLREVIEVKLLVHKLRALGVDASASAVILNIGEHSRLDPQRVVRLVTTRRNRYHLRPDMRLVCYLTPKESKELVESTKTVLRELIRKACFPVRG